MSAQDFTCKSTLPAGKYYIGDLCYVMGNHWGEFCDLTIKGHSVISGGVDLAGFPIWHHTTAYGDGLYDSMGFEGFHFPVDAGLLGICPVGLMDVPGDAKGLGKMMEFLNPVTCSYDEGTFVFESGGNTLRIFTDFEDDDDDGDGEEF